MRVWQIGALFALAFVLFAVARFPMSAALRMAGLEEAGIRYSQAQGTIWGGAVSGARWRGYRLDRLNVGLSAGSLLLGKVKIRWAAEAPGLLGSGTLARGPGGMIAVRNTTVRADLSSLPTIAKTSGTLTVDIAEVALAPDSCRAAEAEVVLDPVVHYGSDQAWQSPPLTGAGRCDGDALLIPLAGTSGNETVEIDMRLRGDLSYSFDVRVKTQDQTLVQTMPFLGFTPNGDTFRLEQRGAWRRAS